jgi:5-methylcytosine-specific restriction endonuclease McrA
MSREFSNLANHHQDDQLTILGTLTHAEREDSGFVARAIIAAIARNHLEYDARVFNLDIQEAVRNVMPYKDFLKTDYWRIFALNAKTAAGNRCQLCNATGELHVHHRTYERRGHEEDQDVIVLCAHCHAKFHDKLPKEDAA